LTKLGHVIEVNTEAFTYITGMKRLFGATNYHRVVKKSTNINLSFFSFI